MEILVAYGITGLAALLYIGLIVAIQRQKKKGKKCPPKITFKDIIDKSI